MVFSYRNPDRSSHRTSAGNNVYWFGVFRILEGLIVAGKMLLAPYSDVGLCALHVKLRKCFVSVLQFATSLVPIPEQSVLSQVEAEIEAFGGVDDVQVTLSTSSSAGTDTNLYTVTFVGPAVAGNVPQLSVIDVGENGCSEIAGATVSLPLTTPEKTLVNSFVPLYKVQNTADLAHDATAADVKAAIETLTGACMVDVARSVMGNGYEWLVTFFGGDGDGNDPLLRAMRPNALLLDSDADYVEPEAVVVPILRTELSTPLSGVPYYVRAAAVNVVGTGTFRTSSPTSLQPAAQPPTPPTRATVGPSSDTELIVQWDGPLSDGGETVSEYVVEWDTAATFDSGSDGNPLGLMVVDASEQGSVADVQAVRVSVEDGKFMAGSFFLEYNGQVTGSIPFDASAVEVETALETLCTVGDVAVSRSLGPANGGYTWLVTMVAAAEGGEAGDGRVSTSSALQTVTSHKLQVDGVNLLTCDTFARTACLSNPDSTSVGLETRKEVQRLFCQTSAGFTIDFMGETTATGDITNGAAVASEIETALEALYNIGDVTVTGSCGGAYVYVTFENDGGDIPLLLSSEDGSFEEVTRGGAQVVVGQKPFSVVIGGIVATPSTRRVRISAYNRIGYSDFAVATHDSSEMVSVGVGAPALPENIAVEVATARSAWVHWDAPASDGGHAVTDYIVEIDTSDGFDSVCGDGPEVQRLTVSSEIAAHDGETFSLAIGGVEYVTCVAWDVDVQALQTALQNGLAGLGDVVVTRGGDGTSAWAYGYTYSITFAPVGADTLANFPEMVVSTCVAGDAIFEVKTVRDGTGAVATAALPCRADNLLPLLMYSVPASDAEGAGDTALGQFGYLVAGLAPGSSYRARVAATNAKARSPWSFLGYPGKPTTFSPAGVPKIARNVTVTPGTNPGEAHVGLGLPVGIDVNGAEGLPLQGFRVEVAKRVYETQVVAVTFAWDAAASTSIVYPTEGSYSLSVDGASTWCLEWDASAEEIELALDSLLTVDGVSVEALQPEVNSTSDAPAAYSDRPMLVSFTGPRLSNGDQDPIGYSFLSPCTAFDAGAGLDVYTVADGVAGTVSPSFTLSTAVDGTPVSGSYLVSFGYRGNLGLRLGEGADAPVSVKVEAGSRTVQSSQDLSRYVSEGDVVGVKGVELVVTGEFACEDTDTAGLIVAGYVCSFAVESPHPFDAEGVPAYGASNSLGSVHIQSGNPAELLTGRDLTPYLLAGDVIIIRDPTSGQYFQGTVSSLDATRVTLDAAYTGPSTGAVRAAAFYRPFAVVPSDASAEELRDAIEALPSVGSAEVSRKGPDKNDGFEWSVTLTSFNGLLSGAHTLQVSSTTAMALDVTGCDVSNVNVDGTYLATGDMVDGRMRYKLIGRQSYIQYDSSADTGIGLWVMTDEMGTPYVLANAAASPRDSILPPIGGTSFWSVSNCAVALPTSPTTVLSGGTVSSLETEAGVEGSFSELVKDVSTQPGVREVQQIQLGATTDALDGTFTVDFANAGGFIAAWDISASDMEVKATNQIDSCDPLRLKSRDHGAHQSPLVSADILR